MHNIGIMGAAGAGKDTLAALLTQQGHHYRRAFADALKEEVGLLLFALTDTPGNRLVAWQMVEARKHIPSVRKLLQWYGQSKRETVNANYWIDQVFGYMRAVEKDAPGWKIVIPDVRYPNEADRLRDSGFLIALVTRPGDGVLDAEAAQHESEQVWRAIVPDFTIVNDADPYWMLRQYEMHSTVAGATV